MFTGKRITHLAVLGNIAFPDKAEGNIFHPAFCPLAYTSLPRVVLQDLGTKWIREEMCIN